MEQIIDLALRVLTAREEQVVRLRFGLGGHTHALDDVEERLGVPRDRVQQIQRRALRKLRAAALVYPALKQLRRRFGGALPPSHTS